MISRDNYNKIYENALIHIESAELLAAGEKYGIAISHLILGIEEFIKYHVVIANSTELNVFPDKEFEAVFRSHERKHELLKEFQTSICAESSEAFQRLILKNQSKQPLTDEESKIKANRFKEIGNILYAAFSENLSKSEFDDFFVWMNDVNDLKNQGFYVGFQNGIWKIPSDKTKAEYERALSYAKVIQKQTSLTKDLDMTDDEFMTMLNTEVGELPGTFDELAGDK